ncbi:MAG: stage 0 sporulation family protein [Bacteroidia bacterium]
MSCTSCGTGSCNKLNVFDWLSDMELPPGQKPYNIVEVRFKGSRKEFFRNTEYLELKTGDIIAVEASPGHDIGTVSMTGELVKLQLKKKGITEASEEIKNVYRIARFADLEKYEVVKALEVKTMYRAREFASFLRLKMKLSDVEYQGDGKKATFFYTAEERVDFRELIKKLAEEFKIRVEMRQIGLRQEAGRLGGIGSCGRELCCSTWLTDFKTVSTSTARYQNLSLNAAKLAGQCGKLKCCLNYELDSYMDALKDIPDSDIKLETAKGTALHQKTDIFKRIMWYAYLNPEGHSINSDTWIALPVDRVKEIVELNKKSIKPEELKTGNFEIEVAEPDYSDVVGQDSLTRMDRRKKKKKKKHHRHQQNRQPGKPGN